ncbi:hypothetical protein [Mycobacterium asiaticum]|nr:hypothetical protein [Mycobacterium asiaticum]
MAAVMVVAGALSGCSEPNKKFTMPTETGHPATSSFMPPIYPGTTVSIPPPNASSSSPSTSTTTSTTPAGARMLPGDGTFRMGVGLQAGTYRSQGGDSCYWERLRGFGGQTADIIANGAGIIPQVVQILPTDAGFRSQGCAPWILQSETTTTTSTTSSTTPVALPPGAQACPSTSGPAGGFTHSAAGSTDTSCPFAEQVRVAYGAGGPASVTPRQVEAVSPVTGQHYTMTCAANGSLVVCNGGNGAVVYVY